MKSRTIFGLLTVLTLFIASVAYAVPLRSEGAVRITNAGGIIGTSTLSCTIARTGHSATCDSSAFPGEEGFIDITITNLAKTDISVTSQALSDNPDVTVTPQTQSQVIPGKSSFTFTTTVAISSSIAPSTTTITITFLT